jgi:hypothetical protein
MRTPSSDVVSAGHGKSFDIDVLLGHVSYCAFREGRPKISIKEFSEFIAVA